MPDFFGISLMRDIPDRFGDIPIDDVADPYLGFFKTEKEAQDYISCLLQAGWTREDGKPLKDEDILVEPITYGQHVPID